jgi:hypothetical protein
MDLQEYANAKQYEAHRAFRRAELSGMTTLEPEPRKTHWFARLAGIRRHGSSTVPARGLQLGS